MRDTVIAILFISGILMGYFVFKRDSSTPTQTEGVTNAKTTIGIENTGTRSEARSALRHEGEGPSDESSLDADQKLTSIYPERLEPRSRSKSKSVKGERKVLHGVPLQPWIASRRNAIPLAEEAPAEEELLRVYLQCMELKKGGPEYVGKSECQRLFKSHGNGIDL